MALRLCSKKGKKQRYPAETMKDVDYADDIVLLANAPTQAESLHSLEQAAGSIHLHVNANKTEYICFNREGAISTLNASSQKLVDNIPRKRDLIY